MTSIWLSVARTVFASAACTFTFIRAVLTTGSATERRNHLRVCPGRQALGWMARPL